ncbi:hypothetical protein [Paludisphaera rhizosphaerae]|nr:hypothetical protein [Paludisphaera rhizosphaerae]
MNHPSPQRPRLLLAVGLALAMLGAIPASTFAAMPVEVENIRLGFGGSDVFKVGAWTLVRVDLKGGGSPFRGFLDVTAGDDDGVPVASRQPVDVPAGEMRSYAAYVRIGGRENQVSAVLYNENGKWLGSRSRDQVMRSEPTSIPATDPWILASGRPQGLDHIREVVGFKRTDRTTSELFITPIDAGSADHLPGRWMGYDGARAVVLDTADHATMEMLAGPKGQALVEWTKRGGHLIVSVGASWQAVKDSVLGPVLPAELTGRERVQSLEAFDTFANSTKPITPPGSPPHMAAKLEQVEERGGKVLASIAGLPLIVRGPVGFGRITLIAVDSEEQVFAEWTDRGLFWIQALDLKRNRFEDEATDVTVGGASRFYATGVTDVASQMRVALEQFPKVKLVSFGLVAFLIFLYILAIGPGDYFFLKKVLKRMELTWITFPLIVSLVSLLAYLAAYRLKGTDLLVNKVDAVDVDQTTGQARGRSWATLFSPQNRDYDLAFLPTPVDSGVVEPLAEESTGEPPRPAAGYEVLTSWFGVPEMQFGGMGGANGRFSFAGSGYAYEPMNSWERLDHVRIPIWSTRTIGARWFGPAPKILDSDLVPVGFDRVGGTVTNLQTYPLSDAVLVFDRRVYLLGELAPGQTLNVGLKSDRALSGELRDRAGSYLSAANPGADVARGRADVVLAAMFHEGESRRTGQEQALGNSVLHDMDLTGQLLLGRPMLVARIKAPGTQLVVGNASDKPRVEQTTVLRVILPLKKAGG